jgi:hypothetical protein
MQGETSLVRELDLPHYLRVALAFPRGSAARRVGMFHDSIEDGWCSEGTLRQMWGDEVADAVVVLTRVDGENYDEYIDRVAGSGPLPVSVKLADLHDNFARAEGDYASLRPRYARAIALLSRV